MSTFSGLNAAYTGLVAARRAADIAGQNVANANVNGYTRQRIELASVAPVGTVGKVGSFATGGGGGVSVVGITRMGDAFLDSQVRKSASVAGYTAARAASTNSLEVTLNEPSATGISAGLSKFWSAWQDLANNPTQEASAYGVIQNAGIVTSQIKSGFIAVSDQWTNLREGLDASVQTLNGLGSALAALNGQIQNATTTGASTSELVDQRNLLTKQISSIAGGSVFERADGTSDVYLGGNSFVVGTTANAVNVVGPDTIDSGAVTLEWADRPGSPIALDGGTLAGNLSMLAPSDASGTGGLLAEAAKTYNNLATTLAAQVNAVHSAASTRTGATGLNFFSISTPGPAAMNLSVVATAPDQIATASAGAGALDGSAADAISQIATAVGSPDDLWASMVAKVSVTAQGEAQQSNLAGLALSTAEDRLASVSSVDLDQESLNLMTSQKAYQAAARVMSAMDEMLDTLINRTGVVGR